MKQETDYFPQITTAGLKTAKPDQKIIQCIIDPENLPVTPNNIKRYRQSYKNQSGVKILHHGRYNNSKEIENTVQGNPIISDGTVKNLLNYNQSEVIRIMDECYENKYQTNQNQPLFKSIDRKYDLPEETKNKKFQYGLLGIANKVPSKQVIFPTDMPIDDNQKAKDQYRMSHKTFQPEEQINRNYLWNVDVNKNFFGKPVIRENEIKDLMEPDTQEDKFPDTKFIKTNQLQFNYYKYDQIGIRKNLFQTNQYVKKDMTYGKRLNRDQYDLNNLIKGNYTQQDIKVDESLGKAITPGFRNSTKQGDEQKQFGVKTIRDDLKNRLNKSIATTINCGNESNARQLISPQKYAHMGLEVNDFNLIRKKSEIKNIFESIDFKYKLGKFEAIFRLAQQIQGCQDVSVNAFSQALQEMHFQE